EGRDRHDRRPPADARQAASLAVAHAQAARRGHDYHDGVTLLAALVRISNQVAATSSRLAKTRELADFLKPLEREEIEIALPYLSGDIRQGKLAVGYAALQSARVGHASAATLSLGDVDAAFQRLKQIKGKGAA